MKPDQTSWSEELVALVQSLQTEESQVYGAWSSVFGPLNTGVVIWRHKDIDTAYKVSEMFKTSDAGYILYKRNIIVVTYNSLQV